MYSLWLIHLYACMDYLNLRLNQSLRSSKKYHLQYINIWLNSMGELISKLINKTITVQPALKNYIYSDNWNNHKRKWRNLRISFQVKNREPAWISNGLKNGKDIYTIYKKFHIRVKILNGLAKSITKKDSKIMDKLTNQNIRKFPLKFGTSLKSFMEVVH